MIYESLSVLYLTIFCLIIAFSSFVHGAIGLGFPLIATPLLAMMTDVKTAVLILVIPTVLNNVVNVLKGGKWNQSISVYWPLAVYGVIGSFIGSRILIIVPSEFFRPVMAGMLIFYLNSEKFGFNYSWIKTYPRLSVAIFGLLAGLLGGTVNVMLPPLIIYALEVKMPKTVMIQVFNLCFLTGKLTQGIVFVHTGLVTVDILKLSIPLAVLGLIVLMAGIRVRDRINTQTYRRWLRRLLAVMAAILVIQSIV